MQVADFSTDLTVDGDRVALTELTFQLFGGRYEGSLTARLGSGLDVTAQSRLENLDVAQLAAFGGSPDTISGTLSGTSSFTGSGADLAAVWQAARGTGTIAILDGAIRRLNLVRTVVLFFGRPAPGAAAGSDRFDRIDARFTLANRVFRAEQFSLRSPDADITGSGTLDAANDALDGRFDLVLSEELSKQAGTDLIRFTREGSRVVVPARLGGTLAAPRLTIDAAAAAGRGLRNEVERRLKGLFDGIGGSPDSPPTAPQP
jgi:AsmA protein